MMELQVRHFTEQHGYVTVARTHLQEDFLPDHVVLPIMWKKTHHKHLRLA